MRSATSLQYLHDQIANHIWAKARLRRNLAVRHGIGEGRQSTEGLADRRIRVQLKGLASITLTEPRVGMTAII